MLLVHLGIGRNIFDWAVFACGRLINTLICWRGCVLDFCLGYGAVFLSELTLALLEKYGLLPGKVDLERRVNRSLLDTVSLSNTTQNFYAKYPSLGFIHELLGRFQAIILVWFNNLLS